MFAAKEFKKFFKVRYANLTTDGDKLLQIWVWRGANSHINE